MRRRRLALCALVVSLSAIFGFAGNVTTVQAAAGTETTTGNWYCC